MTWLKDNWFKAAMIILAVLVLVFSFWWFELRPSQIKKECSRSATIANIIIDNKYEDCLRQKGL